MGFGKRFKCLPGRIALSRSIDLDHFRAALRVIHLQDACLRETIGRPDFSFYGPTGRMSWVSFDLDGPAIEAGHQQSAGDPAQIEHRGVLFGNTGNPAARVAGIRSKMLFGPAAAAGQTDPRQRQRRPHQFEESAARRDGHGVGVVAGKLLVQRIPNLGRVGELFQTPPVLKAGYVVVYR